MLWVTDLTSYMYCPRKLYLRKVKKIKEPVRELPLKGKIKHIVFDQAGSFEREIISTFTAKDSLDDLEMLFRKMYYKVLMSQVQKSKKDLTTLGLKPLAVYQELWPFFLEEAKERCAYFYSFAQEKKLYGDALWMSLPKGISELRVKSQTLGIMGIVDRVELDGDFVPIEIKTGKAPDKGVWRDNMIQLGTYMLLISEHYGKDITEGFVEYRSINERRKVIMNPFLKDEIISLIETVSDLLEQDSVPDKVEEEKKCSYCGIREQCESFVPT